MSQDQRVLAQFVPYMTALLVLIVSYQDGGPELDRGSWVGLLLVAFLAVLTWNDEGHLASRDQVADNGAGDPVTGVAYGYDAAGRRVSMADDAGEHAFGYDAAGNLNSVDHPDGFPVADENFSYDLVGNRLSDAANPAGSMVHDAANRLLRDAISNYVYDGEGNLVSETVRATGATTTYEWATGHQLVKVTKPGGEVLRYTYDSEGRRIKTTHHDGSATVYGYDGQHIAATWKVPVGGGEAVLDRSYVIDPMGAPLQASSVGQRGSIVYPVLDGLGSVTSLLDGEGETVSATAYSVFGEPVPVNAGGSVGLDDLYGFTGHAWEPDLEQYQARARWYDAGAGRFTSEDPVPAFNLYTYVSNQPVDLVDPTGGIAIGYLNSINLDMVTRVVAMNVIFYVLGVGSVYAAITALQHPDPLCAAGAMAGIVYAAGPLLSQAWAIALAPPGNAKTKLSATAILVSHTAAWSTGVAVWVLRVCE